MTKSEIRKISSARLADWLEVMVADHATPVVLVGVGHDKKVGCTSICVPEDLGEADILVYLKAIVGKMEK
jgi:hypothetical protein